MLAFPICENDYLGSHFVMVKWLNCGPGVTLFFSQFWVSPLCEFLAASLRAGDDRNIKLNGNIFNNIVPIKLFLGILQIKPIHIHKKMAITQLIFMLEAQDFAW